MKKWIASVIGMLVILNGYAQTRWAKVGQMTPTGKKNGVVLNDGSWLIEPIYEDVSYDEFVFFASNANGVTCFDTTGKIRLNTRYIEDVYNEDYMINFIGERCEVLTKNEQSIVIANYHDLLLIEDYLMVREGDKVGLFDNTGKQLLSTIYSEIEPREHFFIVYQGDRLGAVSLSGKPILDCMYDYVGGCGDYVQFGAFGAQGIKDTNGVLILSPEYQTVLCQKSFFHVYKNELEGACDLNGKVILQPTYEWIGARGNGVGFSQNGKFGFANLEGKIVHRPIFDQIDASYALLKVHKNNLIGILNADGKWLHQPVFSEVERSLEKNYKVKMGNFWGTLDESGKQIVPCIYEKLSDFSDGTAYGIIGSKAYVFDVKHQRKEVSLEVANAMMSGKTTRVMEVASSSGLPSKLNDLEVFREDQSTIGLKNADHETIIPCEFQEIKYDVQSEIAVLKDGLWGVYSRKGEAIFSPMFSSIDPFVGFSGFSKWTRDEYDFHFTLFKVPKNHIGTEPLTYFPENEAVLPADGGDLVQYIRKHLDYSIDKLKTLDGKSVLVGYIIENDGEAICLRVEDQKGAALDAEVVDAFKAVFSKMPKWKPAVDEGKAVRVFKVCRIDFIYTSEAELEEWKQTKVTEVRRKKKRRIKPRR